mmetsp:Transcript_36252/g.72093  ORF Transcript_36252/g.72093 Transcript_36252/m.72093 type:complete len:242 (-) Transcript_36252:263-988(-)
MGMLAEKSAASFLAGIGLQIQSLETPTIQMRNASIDVTDPAQNLQGDGSSKGDDISTGTVIVIAAIACLGGCLLILITYLVVRRYCCARSKLRAGMMTPNPLVTSMAMTRTSSTTGGSPIVLSPFNDMCGSELGPMRARIVPCDPAGGSPDPATQYSTFIAERSTSTVNLSKPSDSSAPGSPPGYITPGYITPSYITPYLQSSGAASEIQTTSTGNIATRSVSALPSVKASDDSSDTTEKI